MRTILRRILVLCLGTAIVFACVSTQRAAAQDPCLKPNFGEVTLKSGFVPDPFKKDLVAGGNMKLIINNVRMKITRPPDFRLHYEKGDVFKQLTFYVRSKADTTLLIHMPEGGYIADDDSGGNLNPLIRLANPPSGRYDIWVGTFSDTSNAPAVLHITELQVTTPIPKLD
jgi:hypothetical protein